MTFPKICVLLNPAVPEASVAQNFSYIWANTFSLSLDPVCIWFFIMCSWRVLNNTGDQQGPDHKRLESEANNFGLYPWVTGNHGSILRERHEQICETWSLLWKLGSPSLCPRISQSQIGHMLYCLNQEELPNPPTPPLSTFIRGRL